MKRSAVIFVEKATPGTLTEFKDILSNTLLSLLESWSVEFRTYRCLIKNLPPEASRLMYSITFQHHDRKTILIKNKLAMITTSSPSEVPRDLVDNVSSTNSPEPFDQILSSKLSNIWNQRQIIKGEAGETFETTDTLVRAVNLFSYTGFKGLLIELTSPEDATAEEFNKSVQRMRTMLEGIGAKDVKVSQENLNPSNCDYISDLAYQYTRVLEF
ncbi:hypothetical protein ZYGR_0AD04560 [Zygosaccharomyces rouxii]|uniref:Mediator of RNA polymerase II transcription subunit 20 n=2 Tax=Zygosaccharomyces rouxii TaxID=4956 RepID=C5E0Y8_ZYGRC|nr:uncharacterized protein ZYRO0G16654g [Zygosaccharomyces rouxii]KAH9202765.1 mediator complex, subunit Med20 [Zygosaccharomyces rouxii]GAV51273.1 hypothetical protein ZYGR_0AD04560 [Zygosaccharomyces rouxii]CAR29772.1 ZYRO0G16654p [Zygosaccharomyces rouxii]